MPLILLIWDYGRVVATPYKANYSTTKRQFRKTQICHVKQKRPPFARFFQHQSKPLLSRGLLIDLVQHIPAGGQTGRDCRRSRWVSIPSPSRLQKLLHCPNLDARKNTIERFLGL